LNSLAVEFGCDLAGLREGEEGRETRRRKARKREKREFQCNVILFLTAGVFFFRFL
jgi:hypothetical protein